MWHKNHCETEGTKQGERKIGMWKATISPEKRKKIRRSVSFFLSLLLILEMVSGTGMFAEGNRVKAKEETPYAVYLDLSGNSTAEVLASKGIYAYAYDDAAEAEAAEPVKLKRQRDSRRSGSWV